MRTAAVKIILVVLVLSGCASREDAGLTGFPDNPALFKTCTRFYDYILYKDLDVYHVQPGIREFFPDRDSCYTFLDTILPAMWDRNFERNRVLTYTILEINVEDRNRAKVKVHFTSDDVLPFGKVMTADHEWLRTYAGWYPGKVEAPKATRWDKLR